MMTRPGPTPVSSSDKRRRRGPAPAVRPSLPPSLAVAVERSGADPCEVALEAMPGYAIGDLEERDCAWLLDHVHECGYCHSVLIGYERLNDMLDRLNRLVVPDVSPPPVALPTTCRRAGYARIDSPVGPLFIAASDQGICEIGFGAIETETAFQRHLQARGFRPAPDWHTVAEAAHQLEEYFRGERNRFEVPLDFSGIPPFTRAVLSATAEVPFGQLSTYREIARRVGRPNATRAVGNALGRNPIPIIVPCHRIVRSDSSLGGYTGGIEIKERLLSLEGIVLR